MHKSTMHEPDADMATFCKTIACPDLGMNPLQYVLQKFPVPTTGLILEFGVFSGNSVRSIASRFPERPVFGFDSFEGLPEDWGRPDMEFPVGAFRVGGLPAVPGNVTLVPGWFSDTLPAFVAEHASDTVALLHIDCDLYSSTKTVLDTLAPLLVSGTVVVFDELFNYPTYEKHELLALKEFVASTGFGLEWIGKHGPINWAPTRDNGAWDQPAALVLRR